jgi:hypothetical protein
VISITACLVGQFHNALKEAIMPILMVALIALGAFGLIGLMLVLAVTLEQKKVGRKEPPPGKAA